MKRDFLSLDEKLLGIIKFMRLTRVGKRFPLKSRFTLLKRGKKRIKSQNRHQNCHLDHSFPATDYYLGISCMFYKRAQYVI